MEKFNLKQLGLSELTHQEMLEIDGGIFRSIGHFVGRLAGSADSISANVGPVGVSWSLGCPHC